MGKIKVREFRVTVQRVKVETYSALVEGRSAHDAREGVNVAEVVRYFDPICTLDDIKIVNVVEED